MLWVFDSVLNSLSLSPILPSMFRLHIYNFWSGLTHFGFVPCCFINLTCSLSHFCYPSGTVQVLNFKSLWVKDVKGIDFQTAETAKSVWLSLKGRDSPPSWVWVCLSTGWDMHCTKPRAPQGGIIALRLPPRPQALPCFHLSLEEVILLLFWISGEGQPCLCSVGGREQSPGFPTYLLLLRREINMHRAAHTLVYSRRSRHRSCAGRSHALQFFWIIVSSTHPSLPLVEWAHKAQPRSVSGTGICCRLTCYQVLGLVSEPGP